MIDFMKNSFILLLLFSFCLFADKAPYHHYLQEHPHQKVQAPWFTGPLLASSALTIPPGHWDLEPYIFAVANKGRYDHDWKAREIPTRWNNYFQPELSVGINTWLDFEISPTLFYNYTAGAGKWVWGDMPINFDIQLFRHDALVTEWSTAVKLILKETIPFGKYQNLNPKKRGTDVGGAGSWQTTMGLVWGNLFYLGGIHFLSWRTSLAYTLPAPTRVKNLNFYGGGEGTRGTVYPAQNLTLDTAIELSITRNWVFAMDFVGSWSGKIRFKGKSTHRMKGPSSAQFSLAPAIEYNWNANLGIIFGPWFTIAGRNAIQFIDGVFAVNIYY